MALTCRYPFLKQTASEGDDMLIIFVSAFTGFLVTPIVTAVQNFFFDLLHEQFLGQSNDTSCR